MLIYYESRLAKLNINQTDIAVLEEQFEDLAAQESDTQCAEKIKSESTRLEKLVGAVPRLQAIARVNRVFKNKGVMDKMVANFAKTPPSGQNGC